MLNDILKITGTQPLSKSEQKLIHGAAIGASCCGGGFGSLCDNGNGTCSSLPCQDMWPEGPFICVPNKPVNYK